MKRVCLILFFALLLNAALFSSEAGWLSLGLSVGNYYERDSGSGGWYAGLSGMNISGYSFREEKNIGTFYNLSLAFPESTRIGDKKLIVQSDFLFGPGFRHAINDKFKLHYGGGINLHLSARSEIDDTGFADINFGLGIGGDVGLKYNITELIHCTIGTVLAYNFVNVPIQTRNNNSLKGPNEYVLLGIKPYIAVGLNF